MSAPQQEQRTSVQPDLFMHSQSSVCDYKSLNLGSRNGAVRDVSYATATQRLEEMGLQSEAWLHELRTQMDIILDSIPSVQVGAVSALQDAMLAILVNAEGEDTASAATCRATGFAPSWRSFSCHVISRRENQRVQKKFAMNSGPALNRCHNWMCFCLANKRKNPARAAKKWRFFFRAPPLLQ